MRSTVINERLHIKTETKYWVSANLLKVVKFEADAPQTSYLTATDVHCLDLCARQICLVLGRFVECPADLPENCEIAQYSTAADVCFRQV